ncbi:MAG TPA: VWA domain-containing protein [Candidatus Acidoferrales bacterium]|nr:VWA domain-containing protein [Candidatus Acidoferrales bacterium]
MSLVRARVSVLDAFNRPVEHMPPGAFHIDDSGAEAHLAHFERDTDPMSVAFLIDKSGSMSPYDASVASAAVAFARACAPGTEFSVVTVSDSAMTALAPTSDINALEPAIRSVKARGSTALLDGIYAAVSSLQALRDRKRVVIVISDGQSFKSSRTMGDVTALLKQTDVAVFAIKIMHAGSATFEELSAPAFLSDICRLSGGRVVATLGPVRVASAADNLAGEIGKQYILGFLPNSVTPGWHSIKIHVDTPHKELPYHCTFRSGYLLEATQAQR